MTEQDEIAFSAVDVDDVVTLANRERPDEWYRLRVVSIQHGRDTSKPGDPVSWLIVGPNSSHYGPSMFPDDVFKVVDKRG